MVVLAVAAVGPSVRPGSSSLTNPEGVPLNIRTSGLHMAHSECHLNTMCHFSDSQDLSQQNSKGIHIHYNLKKRV